LIEATKTSRGWRRTGDGCDFHAGNLLHAIEYLGLGTNDCGDVVVLCADERKVDLVQT
jgi:hypothetical protein